MPAPVLKFSALNPVVCQSARNSRARVVLPIRFQLPHLRRPKNENNSQGALSMNRSCCGSQTRAPERASVRRSGSWSRCMRKRERGLPKNLTSGARRLRRFNIRGLKAFEQRSGVNAAPRFRCSMRECFRGILPMRLHLIAAMLGVFGAVVVDASAAERAQNRTPWLTGPPDEVGPNYKSWRMVSDPAPSDRSNAPVRVQSASAAATPQGPGVVEIATGMNYWDGRQWSPSDASFELADDGFVANRVQHRTRLSADLNVVGAVTTTLRDGTTLRSTPVAIALYDPNDGRFAVISDFTNSVGMLTAGNRVIYPDAFRGGVCADVIYTLKQGSFEQDVVITGRLNPVEYGFPTNSQIQIITEFYDPPQPEKMRRPGFVEQ